MDISWIICFVRARECWERSVGISPMSVVESGVVGGAVGCFAVTWARRFCFHSRKLGGGMKRWWASSMDVGSGACVRSETSAMRMERSRLTLLVGFKFGGCVGAGGLRALGGNLTSSRSPS